MASQYLTFSATCCILSFMNLAPTVDKRLFTKSWEIRFDDQQEARDVAGYGTLLPFPTVTALRMAALATSPRVEYPVVRSFSNRQVQAMAEELKASSFSPEVVEQPELAARLMQISGKMLEHVAVRH